jgi:hypothetical protein
VIFTSRSVLFLVGLLPPTVGLAQTATRDIVLKTFQNSRPDPKNTPENPTSPPRKERQKPAMVGFTLWHMRPATKADGVIFRGLIHEADQSADSATWAAERASLETPVSAEEFVRLSIESAQKGYMYVIDRDLYADGSESVPTLIFPTLRLRNGDNRVQPGIPIEIPHSDDRPPVFRMKKTRPDQTSLRLTIIVAPQRLSEVMPSQNALSLKPDQLTKWERDWGAKTEQFENTALVGKAYTLIEQQAAKSNGHALSPGSPPPSMIMTSVGKPNDPLLYSVTLKLR